MRSFLRLLPCILFILTASSLWGVEETQWQSEAAQQRDALKAMIQSWDPLILFSAMALLPAFGFPLSLFFFAASALPLSLAAPASLTALAVSMAIGYGMAVGFLRPILTRLLARTRWKIPSSAPERRRQVIFMVRFCGMPFPLQNWILGLAGIPFRQYLLYSWMSQLPAALAFLLLGESLWEGKGGMALAGLMLLLFSFAAVSYWRSRQKEKNTTLSSQAS